MLSAAAPNFSAAKSSSVFRATATSRLKISRNCRSLSRKRPGLRALHVERAYHLVVQDQRHGKRTFRVADTLQIERIFGGVFAKIALARGRHKSGYAVVLRQGVKHAGRRFRIHSHREQRLQAVGLGVQAGEFRPRRNATDPG